MPQKLKPQPRRGILRVTVFLWEEVMTQVQGNRPLLFDNIVVVWVLDRMMGAVCVCGNVY